MRVRLINKEDRDLWHRFAMASADSSCYHSIGWKDVIEQSFGHKTYYILVENKEGEITGIFPLVQMKSIFLGNFMISVPYFNYGGICATDKESYNLLLQKAVSIAERENADHIEIRESKYIVNRLQVKTSKVSMRINLPSSPEELWNSLGSKLRSQIKRPTREEMYWKLGREEELDSFYDVFSKKMRDLGTPVYPKKFFKNILAIFPETTWICTVYTRDGQPAASGFLVGFKDRLEIPWASSLGKYNHLSPNMLLYWGALKYACEQGYKTFDFGRSTPGEGTYKFKEQWGAKPVQLHWYYWLRNGESLPELNPKNPKYQAAIKIWQKLPVAVTKLIGPLIVKNLP